MMRYLLVATDQTAMNSYVLARLGVDDLEQRGMIR